MNKYLISLEKDLHRRELFFQQPHTADFRLFSAVNTMQASPESLDKRFDRHAFLQKYGRNVTNGEVGCTLSHLGVYQWLAADHSVQATDYALVCEDDVLFHPAFQTTLEALLAQSPTADLILLGQSKITSFDDVELEITYPAPFRALQHPIGEGNFRRSLPYRNYYAGTVSYLIKKSAAEILLAQAADRPYWLADDFILFGVRFGLRVEVVRPLMAIENPTLNSNLEAVRGSAAHPLWQKLVKYPMKKALAIQRYYREWR